MISDLWTKDRGDFTGEWTFNLQFAAVCIVGNSATKKVEAIPPSQLFQINDEGRSIIQDLLTDVE